MDGEIVQSLFKKIIKYFSIVSYMFLIGILVYLLLAIGVIYIHSSNYSVTLGIDFNKDIEVKGLGFTPPDSLSKELFEAQELLDETDLALKGADELIEDARRRGILE